MEQQTAPRNVYRIHQLTADGWVVTKSVALHSIEDDNADCFTAAEQWFFERLIFDDLEYIKIGDTMYDIQILPN